MESFGFVFNILTLVIIDYCLWKACPQLVEYFGSRVYLRGSLVIAYWSVRWFVHGPSLDTSETAHCFFLIFCMKLEHHKGTKVTEPDF